MILRTGMNENLPNANIWKIIFNVIILISIMMNKNAAAFIQLPLLHPS